MIEVIGDYFEKARDGYLESRERGQIYEAVVPYSGGTELRSLAVVSAEDGQEPYCIVESTDLNTIRTGAAVPELNLKESEVMLVQEAKCRRVVLLSCHPATWRQSDRVYLVAPLYSFKAADDDQHRSRVKAYAYNTLFWMPGAEDHGMREGCLRLDRVQPVHDSALDAKPVQMTAPALDALIAWYGSYLMDRVPTRIAAYRDEALAQLRQR